jgi:SAM-dependent methyltransferase
VNEVHLALCASPEWATFVEAELLPWALDGADLGSDVLEVGAGPGLTTDVLRRRVAQLTAVEVDETLARSLRARLRHTNVEVVHADGTALPFATGRFSAATCFTMLHHVPSTPCKIACSPRSDGYSMRAACWSGPTARRPRRWPACMTATPTCRSIH